MHTWMADSGRELYKAVRATDRLTAIKVNGVDSGLDHAINAAALQLCKDGGVAVVGSGRSSVEEQFLAEKTRRRAQGFGFASRKPGGGGRQASHFRRQEPERSAARSATGLDFGAALPRNSPISPRKSTPEKSKPLSPSAKDLAAAGLTGAQLAKNFRRLSRPERRRHERRGESRAPDAHACSEKNGTFVNQQFRIQKFSKAVPAPTGATDDLVVLAKLANVAGDRTWPPSGNFLRPKSPRSARWLTRTYPRLACSSMRHHSPRCPSLRVRLCTTNSAKAALRPGHTPDSPCVTPPLFALGAFFVAVGIAFFVFTFVGPKKAETDVSTPMKKAELRAQARSAAPNPASCDPGRTAVSRSSAPR